MISLVLTLIGRLYFVQELDPSRTSAADEGLHTGTIIVPAPRGQIVDALGRPLVDNVVTHQITVDRQSLLKQTPLVLRKAPLR